MKVYFRQKLRHIRKSHQRDAGGWLESKIIDVRADGVSPDENLPRPLLTPCFEKSLNRRSTTWRGLDEALKADL